MKTHKKVALVCACKLTLNLTLKHTVSFQMFLRNELFSFFIFIHLAKCSSIPMLNLDSKPLSEAGWAKYANVEVDANLQVLPDNLTICLSFFFELGVPTLFLQLDWIEFWYDAVSCY